MGRKSDAVYKHMARALRAGFVDPETTDEFPERFAAGTSKAQIVRDLRRSGYTVGKELVLSETKAEGIAVTEVHRTGNIASGFAPKDGYNLRDVDSWTPQQKAKLTRVFNAAKSLSERPFQIYRPRKRENLELVQHAAHAVKSPPELNVAFVPVSYPGERAEIEITTRKQVRVRRGKRKLVDKPMVVIHDGDVAKMPVMWDDVGVSKKQFERDPLKATQKLIDEMTKLGVNTFTPMAGLHEFPRSFNAKGLLAEIANIIETYEKKQWKQFLLGILAFEIPKRSVMKDYRQSRGKAKRAQTAANKKMQAAFRKEQKKAEDKRKAAAKKKRGKKR